MKWLQRILGGALAAWAFAGPFAGAVERLPIELFAKLPELYDPHLSPDGHYLALTMAGEHSDRHQLVIYDLSAGSPRLASILQMAHGQVPLQVRWVSLTRLIVEKGEIYGSLDAPRYLGEIIATDISGKHGRYLYGYDRDLTRFIGADGRESDHGWGRISGLPQPLNNHFAMTVNQWDDSNRTSLYDVDSENGHRQLLTRVDLGQMQFVTDRQGQPLYAYGDGQDYRYHLLLRQNGEWTHLDPSQAAQQFQPLETAPEATGIFALKPGRSGIDDLVRQSLDGRQVTVLSHDDFASPAEIEWTPSPRQPFAVLNAAGAAKAVYIAPKLLAAQLHQTLSKHFPDEYVHFIDFSDDGQKLLFSVSSDRSPPRYMLMDMRSMQASLLFASEPWIQPAQMAKRQTLRVKVSDGLVLEVILTLPPGSHGQPLPMVLMPHGGPYAVRDSWFFDSDAQFLASRGYVVAQVNFRGSGGRGARFEGLGFRQWGGRIQQDLIDVTRQLIGLGYASNQHICTYGASFGGYSAMMSVIRAPGLFQCAIGYAGVYDLGGLYQHGDIQQTEGGRNYLHAVLGNEQASLDASSPDKLASLIKIPVLLIHGKEDQRAPYAQAKAMREALTAAGNPPQWLAVSGEGHGFYQQAHNMARLQLIQDFLDQHIAAKIITSTAAN